jgi:tight adherence protein C
MISTPTLPWLLAALVLTLGAAAALWAWQSAQSPQRYLWENRLRGSPRQRSRWSMVVVLGQRIEDWLDSEGQTEGLLLQAGWRRPREWFYIVQAVLLVLAVLISNLLWWSGGLAGVWNLLVPFVLLALSLLLPRWVLRARARRRQQRLKCEVPLLMHSLMLLFESGLSTRQALSSLAQHGQAVLPELAWEIQTILRHLESGGETHEVLQQVSDHLQVPELTHVLSLLQQLDRYGGEVRGPLSEALARFEERQSFDRREQVQLASGRMTLIMVLFFFPALLIFIAGPAVLALFQVIDQAGSK